MHSKTKTLNAAMMALAIAVPTLSAADSVRLHRDDVIPVVMQTELNFKNTREGDRFRANVSDSRMLPWGSRLEGIVNHIEQKRGDRPAFMDIEFTTIVLPDGHRQSFHGTPIALSKNYVTQDRYGRWEAKKGVKKETVVLGTTAGGLILGSLIKKPFEGAFLGAIAGIILGETDKENIGDGNLVIPKGSKVGARVDEELTIQFDGRWSDTGTYDDRYGDYDREGYNSAGYDRYGYDRHGRYNERYDTQRNRNGGGYEDSADRGYNSAGYDRYGYDRDGRYNARYDQTRSTRNPARGDYDQNGYDRDGYDRNGNRRDDYDYPTTGDRSFTIEVGSRTLRFTNDQRPYQVGSTIMVPLDAMASQLNVHVDKDRQSRTITLSTGDDELALEQDSRAYRLNGRRDSLPTEVEVKGGVTFVPLDVFVMLKRDSVYVNGTRYRLPA